MQNTSVSERTTTPTCSAGDGTAVVGVHEVVRAGVAEVTRSGVHDVPRLHTGSLHPRYPKRRLNSRLNSSGVPSRSSSYANSVERSDNARQTSSRSSTDPAPRTDPPRPSTAGSSTSAAPPSASATSPTTSPDHCSRQADSNPRYTLDCDEPSKSASSMGEAAAPSMGSTIRSQNGEDQVSAKFLERYEWNIWIEFLRLRENALSQSLVLGVTR